MNIMSKTVGDYFLNFFSSFFGTPALLIGLFALVGCLIQRKKFSEVITSVFKTVIGFLIIGGGAGLISGSIGNFGKAFTLLFDRNGYIANNDVLPGIILNSALSWIATAGSLILICAMLLNLVLARISNQKYIYLTGHSAWYFSTMIAAVLQYSGLKNEADMWLIILTGSMLVSAWMVISPSILNRHMKMITKGDSLALAHTGSLTYALSGYIGEAVYKVRKGNVRSTEDINFPKGLNFLRNTNVSIALTMLILFLVVYFTCWGVRGEEAMIAAKIITANDSVFVQGLIQAFTFAAGVEVLLIGVRMFIAEITPAFKGVADSLVPDSKPGIDCPVVFPFAPNAVIMGFIASTIGGFVAFGINIGVSSQVSGSLWAAIIIPSIVPHFFTGATSGVFGNAKGGILGCWIGAFVNGFLISMVPWIFVGLDLIQPEILVSGTVWGDADFILGLIPAFLLQWTTRWGLLGITIALWASLPIISTIIHARKMKNNAAYKTQFLEIKEQRKIYGGEIKNLRQENKLAIKNLKKTTKDKKELYEQLNTTASSFNKLLREKQKEHEKVVKEIRTNYQETNVANKNERLVVK